MHATRQLRRAGICCVVAPAAAAAPTSCCWCCSISRLPKEGRLAMSLPLTTSTGRSWNETADGSARALSSRRLWFSTSRLLMLTSSAYLRAGGPGGGREGGKEAQQPSRQWRCGAPQPVRRAAPGGKAVKVLPQVCRKAWGLHVHPPRLQVAQERIRYFLPCAPPQAAMAGQLGRGRQPRAAHRAGPRCVAQARERVGNTAGQPCCQAGRATTVLSPEH